MDRMDSQLGMEMNNSINQTLSYSKEEKTGKCLGNYCNCPDTVFYNYVCGGMNVMKDFLACFDSQPYSAALQNIS